MAFLIKMGLGGWWISEFHQGFGATGSAFQVKAHSIETPFHYCKADWGWYA
jgi:hypothetical protein